MSIINPQTKEINCKVVYYGPALSGKTTSMLALQNKVKTQKGTVKKEISVKERTLFFDFLALSAREKIDHYKVKFQVYTVPGQVLYEDSRKLLLNGVDGIIFVADSRLEHIEDSIRSFNELFINLEKLEYDPSEIPIVIQYNKRDCPTAAKVNELSKLLNPNQKYQEFETIAQKGKGVFESFEAVVQEVMMELKKDEAA